MSDDNESYESILNSSWDDLPEPKELPVGNWLWKVNRAQYFEPKEDKSGQVVFYLEPKEAQDDVDQDSLEELGDDYDFANNEVGYSFFVKTAKDWDKVKKFIALLGVDLDGLTIAEGLKAVKGANVFAEAFYRTYKDKTTQESVRQLSVRKATSAQ